MRIETERLLIRDLAPMDEERLCAIVWQKDVVRFMGDWSENCDRLQGFIAWHQTQKDSTDVRENKRYAIALKAKPDTLIGMVGMGMEDTLREVEMSCFPGEACQGRGHGSHHHPVRLVHGCVRSALHDSDNGLRQCSVLLRGGKTRLRAV